MAEFEKLVEMMNLATSERDAVERAVIKFLAELRRHGLENSDMKLVDKISEFEKFINETISEGCNKLLAITKADMMVKE